MSTTKYWFNKHLYNVPGFGLLKGHATAMHVIQGFVGDVFPALNDFMYRVVLVSKRSHGSSICHERLTILQPEVR